MMALKGTIRDFYNLLTGPRAVSIVCAQVARAQWCAHGWEIAVILRNFRKTKLSKSKIFFSFFLKLYFNIHTMCNSTTFALRHTQISLSGILRHFRPPSRHLLLNTHDTWSSFRLMDPCSIFFCSSVKPKFFTPTHVCKSCATHRALITCNILYTTWYEGTAQLLSLTEF